MAKSLQQLVRGGQDVFAQLFSNWLFDTKTKIRRGGGKEGRGMTLIYCWLQTLWYVIGFSLGIFFLYYVGQMIFKALHQNWKKADKKEGK